jgi:hypothetical protein
MSDGTPVDVSTLAFGDLATGIWGVMWSGSTTLVAVGTLDSGRADWRVPGHATENPAAADELSDWGLSADGLELHVSPHGAAVTASEPNGFDQLCGVSGRAMIGTTEHELDALGLRSVRHGIDLSRFESLRAVGAWFPPDDALALTALRPRRAKGHGNDLVVASSFDPNGSAAVADPRLSTTYSADGSPARLGLELWLNVSEDSDEQYPRRVAGETLGASVTGSDDGVTVAAYAFRCHCRGSDGLGTYLLARPA